MEGDFIAPEGLYTLTDEYRPTAAQALTGMPLSQVPPPTRLSSVTIRYPPTKPTGGPGLAQLLGGNKEGKKDKLVVKDREDGVSLSSSDNTPEEGGDQQHPPAQESNTANLNAPPEQHTLFSQQPQVVGKRKQSAKPKHGMRGTSSTFITRIQTMEGLSKYLQSKQGEVTYLFYNLGKHFVWIEAGSKAKVLSCRAGGRFSFNHQHRNSWFG